MGLRTSGSESGSFGAVTANDRFKARWSNTVAWSTTMAVAVHAALFVLSPSWERTSPILSRGPVWTAMEAIDLLEAAAASPGGVPTVTVPPTEDLDRLQVEVAVDEGSVGSSDWELAGRSAALLEQLRRRTSPLPTVVDPQIVSDEEEEGLRIGGRVSALDQENDLGSRALELDRLSAVRPELAFLSPSSWVLIQNPSEVADFMVRRFRGFGSVTGEPGTVSVSLWIDERGSVEWAEVNRSSGHPEVDELALEFFNEVVSFRPAREQGVRVPVAVIFSLTFPW